MTRPGDEAGRRLPTNLKRMKLDTITATYTRRVQLKQFEPVEVSATATGTIEDDEDRDEAYDDLYGFARDAAERNLLKRVMETKTEGDL